MKPGRKTYYFFGEWPAWASLLFVSLLVLISWFIILMSGEYRITPGNIVRIHYEQPVVWYLYLLIILFGVLMLVFIRKKNASIQELEALIEKKESIISKNAAFAKQIGQGNYDAQFQSGNEQDNLANSLLLMRKNLLANHEKETRQNWIAEAKNMISGILRTYNKLDELGDHILENLIGYIDAVQGAVYLYHEENEMLTGLSYYAYNRKKYLHKEFKLGYGLIGQCAYERDYVYRKEIPGDYFTITSGILGEQKPKSILIVPMISDEKLQGVIEVAFLSDEVSLVTIDLMKELGNIIGRTIFNLRINRKTERLLEEAQQMTRELRLNEEKLKENAEEMQVTQEKLRKANEQLEAKIREVENTQRRQHSLLENASEIISIYDENLNMTFVSPSVISILGYTPGEMMKGKDLERLTIDGQKRFRGMLDLLLSDKHASPEIQYSFISKDGQKTFLETRGRNMLSDASVKGIILNTRDITESKRAEKEERLKTRMQSLSENSLDMIIRMSPEGQFYYANPITEDYFGMIPADLLQRNLNEINPPESLKEYFGRILHSMRESPRKMNEEISIGVKLGEKISQRIMSIDAIPEFDENRLETILFVGHDITEAKRIEKELQIKNRKIEDSINYAERIQSSILPDIKAIQEHFPSSFVYYKPRDVISGDFPWFYPQKDIIYIAAVDCTGHGVPGALLSFVGYFLLNDIAGRENEESASGICDQLHIKVRETLKQNREEPDARDGMDIALCKIIPRRKKIHFTGAHRSLYFLRNGKLTEYKGDRKSIGGIAPKKRPEARFTDHLIDYRKGDKIFFLTDGLTDQLGGPDKRKYTPRRIREKLTDNPGLTMNQYKKLFLNDFEKWKGEAKQIDDVLMIGIEL